MRLLLAGLLLIGLSVGCRDRQTPACPADAEPDLFSFGTVVAVAPETLTVKEYDFEKDKDVIGSYRVTRDTELGNINRLADLNPGDDVVLDYAVRGKERVATTLVKEEEGDVGEDAAPPVKAQLMVAPDVQQIGDTCLGAKAVDAADTCEPPALQSVATTRVMVPGIKRVLSAEQLPDASQACQVQAFGSRRLLIWRTEEGSTTVALWRGNALQFAIAGDGFATTGQMRFKTPEGEVATCFKGPPAGTDLDLDGVPDLLLYDYSGRPPCCCSTVKHIVCSDPPVITAQISDWLSPPVYEDMDSDGRCEMTVGDMHYVYLQSRSASNALPRVIYRIRQGRYTMAGDLMCRRRMRSGPRSRTCSAISCVWIFTAPVIWKAAAPGGN